jgi:predicted nucleic acid-binding protein
VEDKGLCLDTDILIDYLRGPSEPVSSLFKVIDKERELARITSINAFEVWLGVYLIPEPQCLMEGTSRFLNSFIILDFDYETAIEASRVMASLRRRGEIIDVRDLMIGCISKVNGLHLVTRNVSHYRRIPGLSVLTPAEALKKFQD